MWLLLQEEAAQAAEKGAVQRFLEQLGLAPAYAETAASAIVFLVWLVVIYLLGRAILVPLVDRVMNARDYDRTIRQPLLKVVHIVVVFAAVGAAFTLAGFGSFLTALATIGAAATLAVGFAMQDVLANFVAGVFIFTDRPFRIGDWIEWDGGDYKGIVEDISLRVTRVRTFDNELLTVPNSVLTDDVIKNPVAKDKLRQKFEFGIGYEDDIQEATDIILEEAENHPGIMNDPGPSVRLTELGDSAVGLQSRFWIANPSRSDFVKVRGEYVTAVKERFDAAGIDMPYPYRQLTGGIEVAEPQQVVETTD